MLCHEQLFTESAEEIKSHIVQPVDLKLYFFFSKLSGATETDN